MSRPEAVHRGSAVQPRRIRASNTRIHQYSRQAEGEANGNLVQMDVGRTSSALTNTVNMIFYRVGGLSGS